MAHTCCRLDAIFTFSFVSIKTIRILQFDYTMNLTFTLPQIKEAAEKVFTNASSTKVWAIHGEMGAGKTTFIHALCENLQVTSAIGSPTYSIINEYKSEKVGIIYHMDWYRLKDEEEALQAGVEDCLLSGEVIFESAVANGNLESAKKNIELLGYTVKAAGEQSTTNPAKRFLGTHLQKFLICLPFTLLLMVGHLGRSLNMHLLHNPIVRLVLCLPVFIIGMGDGGKSAINS